MRARHLLIPLFMLAPLAACSDDDDPPTSPVGPTGLDVRATYVGTGYFDVNDASNGGLVGQYTCPVEVVVASQVGDAFTGTWSISAGGDCPAAFAGTLSGTVDGNEDDVTIGFVIPGRDAAVLAISGCQITSGDDDFVGYMDPDSGNFQLESRYGANCPLNGGMVAVDFGIIFE